MRPEIVGRTYAARKQSNVEATVPFTVNLSIDDMNLLDALSERTSLTKQALVKKFVAESAEDMGDVIIAQDVREGIRSHRDRVYTQEELDIELGLDN